MKKQNLITVAYLILICLSSLQTNAQLAKTFNYENSFALVFNSEQKQIAQAGGNQIDISFPVMIKTDNSGGGKALVTTGRICAIIGGGMMGWYLGTKLSDEDSEISSGILIGGAVLATTGIILTAIGSKKINKSLSMNNKYQPALSLQRNYSGANSFSLGLKIMVQ